MTEPWNLLWGGPPNQIKRSPQPLDSYPCTDFLSNALDLTERQEAIIPHGSRCMFCLERKGSSPAARNWHGTVNYIHILFKRGGGGTTPTFGL